jgi:hypothetical protein
VAFKQRAIGQFEIEVEGPHHCGNEHGFLLDNQSFEQYFAQLHTTDKSCELLAQQAVEDFRARVREKARAIKVAIWGIPGAARIEYEDFLN